MPRAPRRWEPDAIHHAVARAHCGTSIFAPDEERTFLVRRAVRAFRETDATCLGWAVLGNHYHVLLRCPGPPGPTFARLNTSLARRVAALRGDRGAVFQNRYYSDPCHDETGLLRRIVYVLGNPLHHRVIPTVDALIAHPWSGLGEVLGLRPPRWTDVPALLALIDGDPGRARRILLDALEAKAVEWAADGGDPSEDRGLEELEGTPTGAGPRRTGNANLVASPQGRRRGGGRTTLTRALRAEGWTPARLVPVACELAVANAERMAGGARTRRESAARGIVAHVASDIAGFPASATAPFIGIDEVAVASASRRGGEYLRAIGQDPVAVLERSRSGT